MEELEVHKLAPQVPATEAAAAVLMFSLSTEQSWQRMF